MTARILVVCSANICRSPMTAALLRARLPGIEVISRGVKAPPSMPACAAALAWLRQSGIELADHASTRLTERDVLASTLVLTATRWHRASVLELRPSAAVRTHTLASAARLSGWLADQGAAAHDPDPSEQVLWLAEQLDAGRGFAPPPPTADADDVRDPHAGGKHPAVFSALTTAVDDLCRPLTIARAPQPSFSPTSTGRRRAR